MEEQLGSHLSVASSWDKPLLFIMKSNPSKQVPPHIFEVHSVSGVSITLSHPWQTPFSGFLPSVA